MKNSIVYIPHYFGSPARKVTEKTAYKMMEDGANGQFLTVPAGEFNALYKTAKGTCIKDPVRFAFNRLRSEGKTKRFA